MLINVEVGILLTFLESMKAKVRLYQKYVSIFSVSTREKLAFSSIRSRSIHLSYQIQKLSDSLGICIEFHRICVKEHPIR